MDPELARLAERLTPRVHDEMRQLVDISTPSGDLEGTERAIELCASFLPGWQVQRPPCSTVGCAPDMLATLTGTGPGGCCYWAIWTRSSPTVSIGLRTGWRAALRVGDGRHEGRGGAGAGGGAGLRASSASFAELSVLLVCDEEWRTAPLAHVARFSGYDACLCFEAGERSAEGEDGVIVRRKGAGTLRVRATGSARPLRARRRRMVVTRCWRSRMPRSRSPERPSPTVQINSRSCPRSSAQARPSTSCPPPASSFSTCALQQHRGVLERVLAAVPAGGRRRDAGRQVGARLAGDGYRGGRPRRVLAAASELLGRRSCSRARGGASDASHFAPDPAHDRRPRAARRRGAHARGVRASGLVRASAWRSRLPLPGLRSLTA